jgi:hypothetical protein
MKVAAGQTLLLGGGPVAIEASTKAMQSLSPANQIRVAVAKETTDKLKATGSPLSQCDC